MIRSCSFFMPERTNYEKRIQQKQKAKTTKKFASQK